MRKAVAIVGVSLMAALAGCGGGKSRGGSSKPTGTHPIAVTSGSSDTSTSSSTASSAADPARVAFGRLVDFVGSTKGMDGTLDYVENDGSSGVLHLTGHFGFDANQAAPAGDLQLQAMVATPVPIEIRLVGDKEYFRQGADPWVPLTFGPTTTPAQSSDLDVAGLLLSDVTPATWPALANGDSGLKATPSTGGNTTLAGALSTFGAATRLQSYPGLGSVHAIKQWPNDVTYTITTDQQGRIVAATEKWTGPNSSATVTINVNAYTAAVVVAPAIN